MKATPVYEMKKFYQMYFLFYFTLCIFAGFAIPIIESFTTSSTKVGLILAGMSLTGVLGQFVLGYLCDSFKTIKKIYFMSMALMWVMLAGMFLVESVIIKMAVMVLIGFFQFPVMALVDSWTLESNAHIKEHFGSARSMGSLGWALSAVLFGMYFDRFGWSSMPWLFLTALVIFYLGVWKIPDGKHESGTAPQSRVTFKSIHELLTHTQYLQLISIFIIIFMAHYAVYTFSIVLIGDYGGGKSHIGFFLFMVALSEMPVFFIMHRIFRKLSPSKVLMAAAFFIGLRALAVNMCSASWMIILTGMFQMLTFSPFISTTKRMVDDICPPHLKTTSQMVAMASFSGVAGMLAFSLSGIIANAYGIDRLMTIAFWLGMMGVALSFAYHRKYYSRNVEWNNQRAN